MNITCPHCQTILRVPDEYVGRNAKCPKCHKAFDTAAPDKTSQTSEYPLEADTKPCPACGETIKASAIKCKYCKKNLSVSHPSADSHTTPRPSVSIGSIPVKFRFYISQGENILHASNPSVGALVLGLIGTGLPLLIPAFLASIAGQLHLTIVFAFAAALGMLICFFAWKHRYYIISDQRTIASEGIFNVAVSIIPNKNIQMLCINTGIIDRLLGLNTVEVSSAAQGGGSIFSYFTGKSKGCIRLRWVSNIAFVIQCYGMV